MIFIEIDADLDTPIPPDLLKSAAQAVLRHRSTPSEADLTILLADDDRMRQLNREYLGIDAPTDVLSFPALETDPETGCLYLGDVVISLPRAAEQAQAAGHPRESELQLLVVHGVLHLLGHDHAESGEKTRMWAAQAEVLADIGLSGLEVREA